MFHRKVLPTTTSYILKIYVDTGMYVVQVIDRLRGSLKYKQRISHVAAIAASCERTYYSYTHVLLGTQISVFKSSIRDENEIQ